MFQHGTPPPLPAAAAAPSAPFAPLLDPAPVPPSIPSAPFAPLAAVPSLPAALPFAPAPPPLPMPVAAGAAPVGPHPFTRPTLPVVTALAALPFLLTLPGPKIAGFSLLNERGEMVSEQGHPVAMFPTRSVAEVFGSDHGKDEHLVLYSVEGVDGPTRAEMPRLTKAAVMSLFDPQDTLGYRSKFQGILRVSASTLALDFDLPEHVHWNEAHREQVQRILVEAGSKWPVLAKPSLFYATNGGLRLVWFLTRPVDVRGEGGVEDLLHGLVAAAHMAGVLVDPACKDWTRLFRLPRVVRADKQPAEAQTWKQGYYAQSWGRIDFNAREALPVDGFVLAYPPESFTPLSAMHLDHFQSHVHAMALAEKWKGRIGRAPRDWVQFLATIDTGNKPQNDAVQLLLYGDAESSSGESAIARQVYNRLKALGAPRDPSKAIPEALRAYQILREEHDVRDEIAGKRMLHNGVMSLVRGLCYSLRDRLGEEATDVTPQLLYAFTIQAARQGNLRHQAEGNKVREDAALCKEVWDVVTWFYTRYRSQTIMRLEDEREEQLDRESLQAAQLAQVGAYQEAICGSVAQWSGGFDGVDDKRGNWVQQNWQRLCIVKSRDGFAVITVNPNGTLGYCQPVEAFEDIAAPMALANHALVPLTQVDHEGKETWRKRAEIMRSHAIITTDTRYSRLVPSNQVVLRNSGDGRITYQFVEALPGMRRDIKPVYHPQVDEWLHLLAGGEDKCVKELMDFLAAFPRIELPSAAMYIQGEPGIGKGMLAKGLAHMTETGTFVKFDHFLTDFQDGLEKTPFVWTDEAVTTKNVTQRVMDTFKMIVTGEANSLNRKGIPRTQVDGNWRMLITANHDHAIPWDQEVSGTDLTAVTQRLHHITADNPGCKAFLDRIGQREGTAGWVEKYIPEHVAYLASTRALNANQRLLTAPVEKEFHKSISISTGYTGGVAAMLGKLMLAPPSVRDRCIIIKDEFVWVLPEPALEATHELNKRQEALPKSTKNFSACLKQLSLDEDSRVTYLKVFPMTVGSKQRAWRLDMGKLIRWLHKNGGNCDLRPFLGKDLWAKLAPSDIRDEFADAEFQATKEPENRVIPFTLPALQQTSRRGSGPPPLPPGYVMPQMAPLPVAPSQKLKD